MSTSQRRLHWFFILIILLPIIFSLILLYQRQNIIPLLLYTLMGSGTFLLYRIDKNRARRGQWRIPETTLHLCELLGGWTGALFAQHWLRHKNRKVSFQVVFWLIVCSHLVFWFDWMLFKHQLTYSLLTIF